MLINLMDILSSNQPNKKISTSLNINEVNINGQKINVRDDVEIELEFISIGEKKLEVKGYFQIVLIIPCSRCMEDVFYTIKEHFEKIIDLNSIEEKETEQDVYVDEYNLNVEQLILQEVIINYPMKVLCKDTCKGICKNCGTNLNSSKCNCNMTDIDPRMTVFQDILNNFKEE